MTTSSKPANSTIRNVPPPPASGGKGTVYSRFIPREELSSFSAWNPGALSGGPDAVMPERRRATDQAPAPDTAALIHAARQQGYQDGYRDGLVGSSTATAPRRPLSSVPLLQRLGSPY